MQRGIDRQLIFQDDEDCEKYLQCLGESQKVSGFVLYACCLMGNHVHLLLAEGSEPLSQIFKRVGIRYVAWYNHKYQRVGHLFQDRFKSQPVEDDPYFISVLRYIYQNPVKALLCKKPEEYKWSSYSPDFMYASLVDTKKLNDLITQQEFMVFLAQDSDKVFIDVDTEKRPNDREAVEQIKQLCGLHAATEFVLLDKERQRNYLHILQRNRCSIRQLARITGLTKAQIERYLRE